MSLIAMVEVLAAHSFGSSQLVLLPAVVVYRGRVYQLSETPRRGLILERYQSAEKKEVDRPLA